MAAVNVQNRVSMAQGLLPAEVTKIGVTTRKRQTSMLVVFSLYDETDTYSESFIENYAKINLIPQVQRVQGVGDAVMYFEVDVGIAAGKKRDTRHDCRNCGRCDAKSENPLFADLCDLKLRRFHVLEQAGGAVVQQFFRPPSDGHPGGCVQTG